MSETSKPTRTPDESKIPRSQVSVYGFGFILFAMALGAVLAHACRDQRRSA